jgi:phosphoribosylamine--glycine ligase
MRILVLGSGGREHALAWKIKQSSRCSALFCAPGNPGMAEISTLVDIDIMDNDAVVSYAKEHAIDLVVVGPEAPLVNGVVDACQAANIRAWGPSEAAAQLEGSKIFLKDFLARHGIPTAAYRSFTSATQAHGYVDEIGAPCVVKADGLAAGKGVTVAETEDEAHAAIDAAMSDKVFGAAGSKLVIEECLRGEEISLFAVCDGHNAILLQAAQDHKQAYDGDQGPNTGGMGAFTPASHLISDQQEDDVVRRILVPTLGGLVKEESPYVGVLYLGLMLTDGGPKVIEYNVRFGDPECQPLMLRLQSDLLDLIDASIDGQLDQADIAWDERTAICVTMASEGYPGNYPKGRAITIPELAENITVFHAGTSSDDSGQLVTSGGRVLSVCALADDLDAARAAVYPACDAISFEGKHLRSDIGTRHG